MAHGRRGSTLLLVIASTLIIATLTVTMLSLTSTNLRGNKRLQARATALTIAESGAELGVLWLRDQPTPPTSDHNLTSVLAAPPEGSTWNISLTNDPNNANQFLKTYEITCTAAVSGHSRRVRVVVRQSTFGKYAYFTDRETSSASGGAIWWNSNDEIDGPVHSNNTGGTNFNINYSGWNSNNPRRPIFRDIVTGCGNTINYQPSRPKSESDFQKVFLNGSKGYLLNVNRVNLPPSTEDQKRAAWGDFSGYPSTTGVYIRSDAGGGNGGIYIHGNAGITMSVDAGGNQIMTVVQGTDTTVIKFDMAAGTTSVLSGSVGPGSPTSAASMSNGVIYCSGNITSLRGTIADNWVANGEIQRRSAWTIATDTNAGKDITITGDLVYATRPDKSQPLDAPCNLAAGTLGIVAQDIKIADDGTPYYRHYNRELNCVMLAGSSTVDGSISVQNYDRGTTGTLKVIGGLIQSTRGPVGTINSSGNIATGYAKDYHYDRRLASAPPPHYPTTGSYDRISWEVIY